MSVTRHSERADWLDRLADYLSREDRFTTDRTLPLNVSTVDGLRLAADQLEGAAERIDAALRIIGEHRDSRGNLQMGRGFSSQVIELLNAARGR